MSKKSGPAPKLQPDEKTLGIVMHVLCLIGFPIIGPLVIWLMKKDQSPYLDSQGRELLNFQISYFLYVLISGLLCAVLIGIPLVFATWVWSMIDAYTSATAWNAAQHASATLSVSLTSCEVLVIVGVEMR